MEIRSAIFVISNTSSKGLPSPHLPEFAFIGRSNVGKSSLINMLTGRKNLAKTSSTPGKTRLINHYLINEKWYLVDLPGYGYAKISKNQRIAWEKMTGDYLKHRENLQCIFVLVDARLEPQDSDLNFINSIGENQLPLSIIFTKCDKLTKNMLAKNTGTFKNALLTSWESLPPLFYSSSETGMGRKELLDYLESVMD